MVILGWMVAGLLLLGIAIFWSIYFATRPWPAKWRGLVVFLGLLGVLAIPFWDLLPAKMYFRSVCRDAGIEILSDKGYGLTLYEDLAVRPTGEIALPWNVHRYTTTVTRKTDGVPVARITSYRISDGHGGFFKPWLAENCPKQNALRNQNDKELQKILNRGAKSQQ